MRLQSKPLVTRPFTQMATEIGEEDLFDIYTETIIEARRFVYRFSFLRTRFDTKIYYLLLNYSTESEEVVLNDSAQQKAREVLPMLATLTSIRSRDGNFPFHSLLYLISANLVEQKLSRSSPVGYLPLSVSS